MSAILWQGLVTLRKEPSVKGQPAHDPVELKPMYRLVTNGDSTFTVEVRQFDTMGEPSWSESTNDTIGVLVYAHALQELMRRRRPAREAIQPFPAQCASEPLPATPAPAPTFPSDEHGPLF